MGRRSSRATAVVALAALLCLVDARSQVQETCLSVDDRERVRDIMIDALDQALKEQLMHLFEIWMKDYVRGQRPERTLTGARNAVDAYVLSRSAALRWDPPTCPQ